jgi:molybdate/tungstate transport system substrate-binding protein
MTKIDISLEPSRLGGEMTQRRTLVGSLLAISLVAAACGSSNSTTTASPPTTAKPATAKPATTSVPRGSGPVQVLYAGSLVDVMEKQVGPQFNAATGYTFNGFSAGSDALANQIKGKVRQGDVFVSASPTVNAGLEGVANGSWVTWYATFASAPLVIGYNPSSKFAQDLKTKPWYQVVGEAGFQVGRTDPALDPKGKLTAKALQTAASSYNLPALAQLATSGTGVFPEETLLGRLQAGQLDAGFFYSSEAAAAKIPTVSLAPISLEATYTVATLNQAPDTSAAQAFVAFLLGPKGRALLASAGFTLVSPATLSGDATQVPPMVRAAISSP